MEGENKKNDELVEPIANNLVLITKKDVADFDFVVSEMREAIGKLKVNPKYVEQAKTIIDASGVILDVAKIKLVALKEVNEYNKRNGGGK